MLMETSKGSVFLTSETSKHPSLTSPAVFLLFSSDVWLDERSSITKREKKATNRILSWRNTLTLKLSSTSLLGGFLPVISSDCDLNLWFLKYVLWSNVFREVAAHLWYCSQLVIWSWAEREVSFLLSTYEVVHGSMPMYMRILAVADRDIHGSSCSL